MINKIKNIFFDFDGVLAESVNAKTEAFRDMYSKYGNEISNKVVEHHIKHGGVSRFEKFKIYHKEFLNIELKEGQINELATQFSEIVFDKVLKSNEVSGAENFLNKYNNNIRYWIITGTPTQEIIDICIARNMKHYFEELCGSPKNKRFWTEYLLDKYNLKRKETLFLGDATTDYDAAKFSKIHFALREHDENIQLFQNFKGIRFNNFKELEKQIEKQIEKQK